MSLKMIFIVVAFSWSLGMTFTYLFKTGKLPLKFQGKSSVSKRSRGKAKVSGKGGMKVRNARSLQDGKVVSK